MAPSQATPSGLAAAGLALWDEVTGGYELDAHELLLLLQAARCADRLDSLAAEGDRSPVMVSSGRGDLIAHPAIVESRQQSIALARLLASLRLPSGEDAGGELVRPQRRGAARPPIGCGRSSEAAAAQRPVAAPPAGGPGRRPGFLRACVYDDGGPVPAHLRRYRQRAADIAAGLPVTGTGGEVGMGPFDPDRAALFDVAADGSITPVEVASPPTWDGRPSSE